MKSEQAKDTFLNQLIQWITIGSRPSLKQTAMFDNE